MKSFSVLLSLLLSNFALANQVTLESLGGEGTKIYNGVNRKAWIYKDCKVTIAGSRKTPVIFVSVSDSESSFDYWTHSKTFAASPGYDAWSATASDNMNQILDDQGTKIPGRFSNTSAGQGGISSLIFQVSPKTKALEQVEFSYYGQPKNTEILCTDLKLR